MLDVNHQLVVFGVQLAALEHVAIERIAVDRVIVLNQTREISQVVQ